MFSISARTCASPTAIPLRSAAIRSTRWSIIESSTLRLFSIDSNSALSNASPCCARCCWRTCANWLRNSSTPISSRSQSMVTGQNAGADGHHAGAASILAA